MSVKLASHDVLLHGLRETLGQDTRSRWSKREVVRLYCIYVKLVGICAELVTAAVAGIKNDV